MTLSSCKRDTKSKSHPGMKRALVRVFTPLLVHCPLSLSRATGDKKERTLVTRLEEGLLKAQFN